MRTGSGQADDPPAAGQKAGPVISSPSAGTRLVTWHGDLLAPLDRLGWLRTLSDRLSAVLGPLRERHQDNLALELLHGGRWVGHPLHPALSDLPVGLWTGVVVLDATDRDPAPRRGIDAAGVLSAAGILAAGATALTGLSDWTRQRGSGPPHRALPRPPQHGGPRAARCLPGHPDRRPP